MPIGPSINLSIAVAVLCCDAMPRAIRVKIVDRTDEDLCEASPVDEGADGRLVVIGSRKSMPPRSRSPENLAAGARCVALSPVELRRALP